MWNSNISSAVLFSDYSCKFETGDGVGGTEQNIRHQPAPQACIDACATKKQTDLPEIHQLWGSSFFCKCLKLNIDSQNGKKSWEKIFGFWDNCFWFGCV